MNKKVLCGVMAVSFLLSAAGCKLFSSDPVIATVGDYEITAAEYDFYLNNLKQQMQGTELSSDEDWQTVDINGKKAIDIIREKALETALDNIAYIEVYKNLGNEFDDEAKQSITEKKNDFVSQNDQNGGYEEFLQATKVTDEFIDFLCESTYCFEQLYNQFTADTTVTDEEIKAFYDENQNEYYSGYRRAKHVLIFTQDPDTQTPYTEEQKAEAKKRADDIYQRALSGEDFDSLVNQYSEDPGSATNPDGYVFTDGEMVQAFQDCVDSLEIGGIGFCESEYGYHIIQRLAVDETSFADDIRVRILSNKFMDYMDEKKSEYGITLVETAEMAKIMNSSTSDTATTEDN